MNKSRKLPVTYFSWVRIYFLISAVVLCREGKAQKTILISDSLLAHADMMIAKMGSFAFGKIKKFSFGEYAIVASNVGGTSGTDKSNLLGTRSESTVYQRFAFTLVNGLSDTAVVDVEYATRVQSQQSLEVVPHIYVGDESTVREYTFAALISFPRDTAAGWNLSTRTSSDGKAETLLRHGTRRMLLTRATSDKDFDYSKVSTWTVGKLPAMGYEFLELEDGRSLGAVQYSAGGTGMAKDGNKIWIDQRPDARMRLVLASAATAILLRQSPMSPIH